MIKYLLAVIMPFILLQQAQGADLTDHPGYVDFSSVYSIMGTEPNVEVNLNEPLLNLVTGIMASQDGQQAQAASFISSLLSVNVRVFNNMASNQDAVINTMTAVAENLDAQQWQRIVRVREDQEHVDVYFRLSDDASLIHGITVMVSDSAESVLINIVGDISPDDINALAAKFDIDELSNLEVDNDNN
jgi:hypothetical protein